MNDDPSWRDDGSPHSDYRLNRCGPSNRKSRKAERHVSVVSLKVRQAGTAAASNLAILGAGMRPMDRKHQKGTYSNRRGIHRGGVVQGHFAAASSRRRSSAPPPPIEQDYRGKPQEPGAWFRYGDDKSSEEIVEPGDRFPIRRDSEWNRELHPKRQRYP